jgi:hypothetical protein
MKGMQDRIQCHICGRICSWNSDSSINFGGYEDMEPPDPDFYCKRCVSREYRDALKNRHLPHHWVPARWEFRAAKKLGFVRMNPKSAAWGEWISPERIDAKRNEGWVEAVLA